MDNTKTIQELVKLRELIDEIWSLLQENTEKLNQIPEREQRFDWQDIANLRGMFRDGPNKTGKPIDRLGEAHLKRILWRLQMIQDSMRLYRLKKAHALGSGH